MLEEIIEFYNNNADFRRIVDDNAKGYGKDPSYMLQTRTTWLIFKEMQRGGINEPKHQDRTTDN